MTSGQEIGGGGYSNIKLQFLEPAGGNYCKFHEKSQTFVD